VRVTHDVITKLYQQQQQLEQEDRGRPGVGLDRGPLVCSILIPGCGQHIQKEGCCILAAVGQPMLLYCCSCCTCQHCCCISC